MIIINCDKCCNKNSYGFDTFEFTLETLCTKICNYSAFSQASSSIKLEIELSLLDLPNDDEYEF